MYQVLHRTEAFKSECQSSNSACTPPHRTNPTQALLGLWFLLLCSGLSVAGQASAADRSTAKSFIQIVKTASVSAQTPPARLINPDSAEPGHTSIPVCLTVDAPHSVTLDGDSTTRLIESNSGETVDIPAKLSASHASGGVNNCLTHPLIVEFAFDTPQWHAATDGSYAGSLRVIVEIE